MTKCFIDFTYNGQVFKPLWKKDYAIRLHTRLGYADSFGSTSQLPFFEHYFAGGFSSVRGFRDNTMGPRSTPNAADTDQTPQPFGGNVLITGGAELLFPTPFVKDQRSLRTVLFWDVGNVFDTNCSSAQKQRGESGCNLNISDLGSTVGVGMNWLTAMGPLSFSLGIPIKKPSNSNTQMFQFSLGQSF